MREFYTQEITRRHRAAIIIAIDQSGSMSEDIPFGTQHMSKAEAVTIVTSRFIDEMIMRATREGEVRNYYDVAIIGYSNNSVYSLCGDKPAFIPITELVTQYAGNATLAIERRMPDGKIKICSEQRRRWIEPHAAGTTPTYEMLCVATTLVKEWCAEPQNYDSLPPIVLNITDGEATDASDELLYRAATRLKAIATNNGNTMLINIHLSSSATQPSLIFPRNEELIDPCARQLAKTASEVPQPMVETVRELRGDNSMPPYLMMSYNASLTEALSIINIGSRSLNNIK